MRTQFEKFGVDIEWPPKLCRWIAAPTIIKHVLLFLFQVADLSYSWNPQNMLNDDDEVVFQVAEVVPLNYEGIGTY